MAPIDNTKPHKDLTHEDIEALRQEIQADAQEDAEKLPEKFGPGIPTVQEALAAKELERRQGAEIEPEDDASDAPISQPLYDYTPDSEGDQLLSQKQELEAKLRTEASEDSTPEMIEAKIHDKVPPDLPYDRAHQGEPLPPDGPTDQPVTLAPKDEGDE